MMKYLLFLTLLFATVIPAQAQSPDDEHLIKRAALNYIEGFYEGDSTKLKESLKPSLFKYGYWRSSETGEFGDEIHMSYQDAIQYAVDVQERQNFPSADAPRKVEILDRMSKIAAVKITAWWGVDYMLLSKQDDKWMISQVIWQGPFN